MSPSNNLSVFDIQNIFRRHWFLSRASLLSHVVTAQKAANGKVEWVEFDSPFHSHLVKCACTLVPRPVQKVKKVMFVFIFEVLNDEVPRNFFDLPPAKAKREQRRLSREQQQGEARAECQAAPNSGRKKRVERESQEPRPAPAALDRGPSPRLHGVPKTRPPPPLVEPTPSPSPLLSLILKAPRRSLLYPIGDNPTDGEWDIPESQDARWGLYDGLRKNFGDKFMRIVDWEVVDNGWGDGDDLADPAEEMDVEHTLGMFADL
ncbi:hypothetical protein BC826DRAFT_1110202, partial [Russula brevipes]